MRAAIFERQGLDNLNVKDVEQPTITDHDVLIKVKSAGVNPIDYLTVSNIPGIKPLPHIPGAEVTGIGEPMIDSLCPTPNARYVNAELLPHLGHGGSELRSGSPGFRLRQ